ncbi:MAG: lasso peptide biosynthesis B2 protein [Acidobacteriota bacterium]
MTGTLHKVLALSGAERVLLARAWLLLLLAEVCLRVLPFRITRRVFEGRLGRKRESADGAVAAPLRIHELVEIAARRHIVRMSCLRRALVLQRLLRRQGFAAELRLGVVRREELLHAHAWVELDGAALGEREDVLEGYVGLRAAGAPAGARGPK